MTFLEDVQAEIGQVKDDIIQVVTAVDLKVEALFKIIADQQAAGDVTEAGKAAIDAGLQDLKASVLDAVTKVGEDDPNTDG